MLSLNFYVNAECRVQNAELMNISAKAEMDMIFICLLQI